MGRTQEGCAIIVIKQYEDVDDSWLEITGHAEGNATTREGTQVCAAVSALSFTLWNLAEKKGRWDGDKSGFIRIGLGAADPKYVEFVLDGLSRVAEAYPGHIDMGPAA